MEAFSIGDRPVGESVFIIAEIGVNHDGSVERALELVEHAYKGGADGVKVQIFKARSLMHGSGAFAAYQQERCDDADPAAMLARYELSADGLRRVMDAVRQRGMVPLATPFSLDDVEMVRDLDLPVVKIASPDLVNWPLLERVANLGRPMLLSTGAATMEEVEETAGWLRGWGVSFALLHCVSSYPTPVELANLAWIGELARFGAPVGYSDHTTELSAGAMAVAGGAVIVEKHLTYDRDAAGPDHSASAAPGEFAEYVWAIRLAEKMLGRGGKRVLEVEEDVRRVSRQSLVAARELEVGRVIGEGDLTVQRPGTGMGAREWKRVIGRKMARGVKAGAMLGLGDIEGNTGKAPVPR